MVVTRFNPTTNGALHVGHIYTLIFNERLAHNQNGKFYIRFDDTSPPAASLPDEKRQRVMDNQHDDIEWLDVDIDGWQLQSELCEEVTYNLDALGFDPMVDILEGYHTLPIVVRMIGTGWFPYPYVPQQTAERVMMDHMLGVTHVIRGEEFFSEFSLYSYFCEKFDFKSPEFIFLPRLMGKNGDISKTNGGYTIAEFRSDGYSPDDVKRLISKAALIYPNNGWNFANLKPNPRLDV